MTTENSITENDIQKLRDFLRYPGEYSSLYGFATVRDRGGTLILNNRGEKPIDYFLSDNHIDGRPITDYTTIVLTKKQGDKTETIVLPKRKITKP